MPRWDNSPSVMQSARVVSVALEVPRSSELDSDTDRIQYNLDNVCEALEVASQWNPDFVCFPELMLHRWWSREDDPDGEQPVPGPATDRVGELAAELDSYVWLPLAEVDGERKYNSVALIEPSGEVRGQYRKRRPTVGEIESGREPGQEIPVWETPFGRVGAMICFDLMYPEIAVEYARKRADIVFFPSYLQGRERMKARARENGFYVVKANPSIAEIATPTGDVTARNQGSWEGQEPLEELEYGGEARFAFNELNTDMLTFTRTPRNRQAVEEIQKSHPDIVYHDSGYDETFVLESRSDDVTVEELESEYDMVTYRDWLDYTANAGLENSDAPDVGLEAYPRPDLQFDPDYDV